MSDERRSWQRENQRYLAAAVATLGRRLDAHAAGDAAEGEDAELARLGSAMSPPPALDTVAELFGLSAFERELLVLAAAVELDAGFAQRFAALHGADDRTYPTFGLGLAALAGAHWSALSPAAPLRRWRLVELGQDGPLTARPLRIDERILHYLAGVQHLDERLAGLIEPLGPAARLVPSHQRLADQIAALWTSRQPQEPLPAIQLTGRDDAGKRAIAAAAAAALGLEVAVLPAAAVPTAPNELDGLERLWQREAVLGRAALLLDCDDLEEPDAPRMSAISRLIDHLPGPLVVTGRGRRRPRRRPLMTLAVDKPTADEQRQLWRRSLGEAAADLDGRVDRLVGQFRLGVDELDAAAGQALAEVRASPPAADPGALLGKLLWDACRRQSRPRLEHLAQKIEPLATWADLVLPSEQLGVLRQLALHARQRLEVHEDWGFAARSSRGLGLSALFAGVSGTGKTMAAEVLANELELDLYRIDLAGVVSKYIGETEKNLRRVFDAADDGGGILLFDEADALFGKRSEVRDSHDRYANIEVSYLLQRMEAYQGLAILTTNMKNALDSAFLRRLRFVVEFPFPNAGQRARIWDRVFPRETPTEGLDTERLARLNVAGGNIRNIALSAAFLASGRAQPVRMEHLLEAARGECKKLERPLAETEIRGWLD